MLHISVYIWHSAFNRGVVFEPILEMIAVEEESIDVVFVIRRYLICEPRFDFTKPVVRTLHTLILFQVFISHRNVSFAISRIISNMRIFSQNLRRGSGATKPSIFGLPPPTSQN